MGKNAKVGLVLGVAALGTGLVLLLRKKGVPPPSPGLANLVGIVKDTYGANLPGVTVTLNGYQTTTGSDGRFVFTDLEPGIYTLTFELAGYQTVSGTIDVVEGENTGNVELTAIEQPPVIAAAITDGFFRNPEMATSPAFSGWADMPLGDIEVDLTQFGFSLEAGFIWQNNSNVPVTCEFTIWHRWWRMVNSHQEYVTDPPFDLPAVEPAAIPPAPTGLPYANYQLLCDKFTPPGSILEPGQKGFIYTPVFVVSRRWNYIYITLKVNGQEMGTWHIGGWGGY